MKQFEVEIMGQPYVLSCAEGDERRFHAAVEQVDGTMNRIRDAGKVRARDRIAVLAALNLALELVDRDGRAAEAAPPPAPVPAEPDGSAVRDAALLESLLRRLDEALGPREADPAIADAPAAAADDGAAAPAVSGLGPESVEPSAPDAPVAADRAADVPQEVPAGRANAPQASEDAPREASAQADGSDRNSAHDSQDSRRPADAAYG